MNRHPDPPRPRASRAPNPLAARRWTGHPRGMRRSLRIGLAVALGLLAVLLILPLFSHRWHSHRPFSAHHLGRLVDGARAYYEAERFDAQGLPIPAMLPESAPPLGAPCGPPTTSDHPTWAALHVGESTKDLTLVYRREAPDRFVAAVYGDRDCDGVQSTFERHCAVDAAGDIRCVPFEAHPTE